MRRSRIRSVGCSVVGPPLDAVARAADGDASSFLPVLRPSSCWSLFRCRCCCSCRCRLLMVDPSRCDAITARTTCSALLSFFVFENPAGHYSRCWTTEDCGRGILSPAPRGPFRRTFQDLQGLVGVGDERRAADRVMIVGIRRAERGEQDVVEPVDDCVDVAPWGGGSLSPAGGGGKHDGHGVVRFKRGDRGPSVRSPSLPAYLVLVFTLTWVSTYHNCIVFS